MKRSLIAMIIYVSLMATAGTPIAALNQAQPAASAQQNLERPKLPNPYGPSRIS